MTTSYAFRTGARPRMAYGCEPGASVCTFFVFGWFSENRADYLTRNLGKLCAGRDAAANLTHIKIKGHRLF
jgi:hypothetical protein